MLYTLCVLFLSTISRHFKTVKTLLNFGNAKSMSGNLNLIPEWSPTGTRIHFPFEVILAILLHEWIPRIGIQLMISQRFKQLINGNKLPFPRMHNFQCSIKCKNFFDTLVYARTHKRTLKGPFHVLVNRQKKMFRIRNFSL